ncbi:MAG: ATP-binding protein [Janthinobacterium sp.]|jgi:predicted ATPase
MKINLPERYKSLFPFQHADELPSLAVITGKNGSGKTHFLEAFESGAMVLGDISSDFDNRWGPSHDLVYFDRFDPHTLDSSNESMRSLTPAPILHQEKMDKLVFTLIDFLLENNLLELALDMERIAVLSTEATYDGLLQEIIIQSKNSDFLLDDRTWERQFIQNNVTKSNIEIVKEARRRDMIIKKEFAGASVGHDFPELVAFPSLAYITLTNVHAEYVKRRYENNIQSVMPLLRSSKSQPITDEEFTEKYPPPLETLNKILADNGLGFSLSGTSITEYHSKKEIKISVIHERLESTIGFRDLSAGEAKIFGIILKIFYSVYFRQALNYPKILLFDEPDAHLQPGLVHTMINILQGEFVIKNDLSIIITTHSPTTVAIAPSDSLFEIKNGQRTSLNRITKDDALSLLTAFLPTLSIDYKSHRQVFVEGENDRDYYQKIFNKRRENDRDLLTYNIYFISGKGGESNSDQVLRLVEYIRDTGNRTSFGVIDWDINKTPNFPGNSGNKHVFVHGQNERYSLENYLFDPIYCIALLIQRNENNICEELGYSSDLANKIGDESNERLQEFVDYFFQKIAEGNPIAFKSLGDQATVRYGNGRQVVIPTKYLLAAGHKVLMPWLRAAFPDCFQDDVKFKEKVIEFIEECYPFVPQSSIDLINELAN